MITGLVPEGISRPVIEALREKMGITTVTFEFARGIGKSSPLVKRGIGEQTEKEILHVIVPNERADEVFAFVFEEAKINRPHGGLLYSYPLLQTTTFTIPDISELNKKEDATQET
ncbi:MAG: hypothetical protein R8K22_02255 [Mariprofundaceae bacterium]